MGPKSPVVESRISDPRIPDPSASIAARIMEITDMTTLRRTGAKITGAVAGLALGLMGVACAQSMPVTDELKQKWEDKTIFDLEARSLDGKPVRMADWKGKAVLVVNVASRCGFTGQYRGLQALSEAFKDRGLVVVGFPCNDFGGQEPGSAEDIREFCSTRYEVDFPMMEKISTKPGGNQSAVYEFLGTRTGKLPGWNFCKYLVSSDGTTIEFFDSRVDPNGAKMKAAVEKALPKKTPATTDAPTG